MKNFHFMFYISMVLMILLAACAPASTPTATSVPVSTSTSAPLDLTGTAPPDLSGPPMKVGSTFLYFDGTTLVAVPGGPFTMGHGTDNPEHKVTLGDFWIYATKVTNSQFQQCVAVGKCTAPDTQANQSYTDPTLTDYPVTGVNWAQSEAYCEYANGHLPTEAQWEKAARGPKGNLYPWGSNAPSTDLLNFNDNVGATTDVIQYPQGKSYYDALDMEGNVYEWVHDWYDPSYYSSSPNQDPQGPNSAGGQRSVRSAGYKSNNDQVVSSVRSFKLATDDARDLGFRCVVKKPTFFAPACQLTSFIGQNLGGDPGQSNPSCQPPTITVNGPDCSQDYGVVTVKMGTGDSNVEGGVSGGCKQLLTANQIPPTLKSLCTSAGTVSVKYTCGSAKPTPSCPKHYKLDQVKGVCVWDGSGTGAQACPAGQQLMGNCCTSTPGTGTNFNACPVGTVDEFISRPLIGESPHMCVQTGALGAPQSKSVSVSDPPSAAQCSSGGGSCQQPAGGCGTNKVWCASTCSCQYYGCH